MAAGQSRAVDGDPTAFRIGLAQARATHVRSMDGDSPSCTDDTCMVRDVYVLFLD